MLGGRNSYDNQLPSSKLTKTLPTERRDRRERTERRDRRERREQREKREKREKWEKRGKRENREKREKRENRERRERRERRETTEREEREREKKDKMCRCKMWICNMCRRKRCANVRFEEVIPAAFWKILMPMCSWEKPSQTPIRLWAHMCCWNHFWDMNYIVVQFAHVHQVVSIARPSKRSVPAKSAAGYVWRRACLCHHPPCFVVRLSVEVRKT